MTPTYDTIVLGMGGMGSAAAMHLAGRGQRVLGLDRYGVAHDRGSSHGETRIIRRAYFEHADYVPLLDAAYPLWQALAEETGADLIDLCGLVMAGRPDDDLITGSQRSAELHGQSLDVMDAAAAREQFPGLQFDDGMSVLYEADGGLLYVERCVQAHADRAKALGADLRLNEPALSWSSGYNAVTVETEQGTYHAASLVLCAGAWTASLLADLNLPLSVERVVTGWFPTSNAAHRLDNNAPVYAYETPDGFYYGFPSLDGETVKIAEHMSRDAVPDPATVSRDLVPGELDGAGNFATRYLRHVSPDPTRHAVCMYTMTPDGHFIVDTHPQHANVHYACGFSGHGFKFAPAIGQALADLATEGKTELPVGFLSAKRNFTP